MAVICSSRARADPVEVPVLGAAHEAGEDLCRQAVAVLVLLAARLAHQSLQVRPHQRQERRVVVAEQAL